MEYIELGQIVNTHALKGSVKINIFSDKVENIKKYEQIYLKEKDKYIEYEINDIKFFKNQAIVNFKNINNKEEADKLRNKYIYIKKDSLEELEDDSYYLIDLIGIAVYESKDNEEKLLGELVEVKQDAPTDIYVIKQQEGNNIMIPAVKEYIKEVDIKGKKIIVDLSNYEI